MNGDGAITWQEVVSDHCARFRAGLVDEIAARLDSELDRVRTETAARVEAQVRAEEKSLAAAALDLARTKAEAALDLAHAKAEGDLELARSDAEAATARVVHEARHATAESLNQALRRIRQTTSEAEALHILLECAAARCSRTVVLGAENNQARSLGSRGLAESEITFSLDSAAAIANVFQNGEPVVALASDGELSPELGAALSLSGASPKAYLFPVAARQNVIAVLVAAGDPVPAALELLSEAAGMKIEALQSEAAVLKPLPTPELVHIAAPAAADTASSPRLAWSDLSPEDQKLHLQAQRVARVKAAEMRLYHAEELRKGVFDGNIYNALQPEIDKARADFLQDFLSKSRTMVDYLHLEILRSLAHEDDRLLGQHYPGPMV